MWGALGTVVGMAEKKTRLRSSQLPRSILLSRLLTTGQHSVPAAAKSDPGPDCRGPTPALPLLTLCP